jgi:homoserine kinase type II
VRPHLDAERNALLAAEIKFQTGFGKGKLPRGAIHGDLFCDNVLFERGRVSGIIDFGFAATDFLAYDLAITVNDWCIVRDGADQGALVPELVGALTGAYQAVRPLTQDERAQWPALLRAAALRFWLSRLYDLHLPRPGELVHAKDPSHFERILRERIARPARLAEPAPAPSSVETVP